jgi:hypothetical protein
VFTLGDLFEDLAYGPLNQLAIGGDGSGMVPDYQEARLVSYINRALLELYSKFILSEKEFVIRVQQDRTLYPLRKIHADSFYVPTREWSQEACCCDPSGDVTQVCGCQNSVTKFIADSPAFPFEEDIIRILHVFDDDGIEVPINDQSDVFTVFTPAPDVLQIPDPQQRTSFAVNYQARHKVLEGCDCFQRIYLPLGLKPALEAHVAYQVFNSMNGQEHSAKAQEYYARYDMMCTDAEYKDLTVTSIAQDNCKLFRRGFI